MIIVMPIVSIYYPPVWPLRLLAVLFTPFMFTMPVAPPIVFALFFDQIGSDKAKLKRASRALSGAILALAMMYMSFAFAMAGRFEIFWNTDELIFLAMLTLSGSLAIFGFRRVRSN